VVNIRIGVNADICLRDFYHAETFEVQVLNTQVLSPDLAKSKGKVSNPDFPLCLPSD
jgi:hypothetical protein